MTSCASPSPGPAATPGHSPSATSTGPSIGTRGRGAAGRSSIPRVLRHTFCTHLADSGQPIDVIPELAGHADIHTTTIYTDVAEERLEDAIAAASHRRRGLGRLTA
jgi:integrase